MTACGSCGAPRRLVHVRCPACGVEALELTPPARDGEIGRSFPGGYVLLDLLAVGTTSRIYAAEQAALARTVAVKLVPAALAGDDARVGRLLAEVRHASRLEHPNAVRVFDMGTAGRGDVFVVMELLRGRSLLRLARTAEGLGAVRLATIVARVLDALAEAHHLGVCHGHLTPSSVLVETTRAHEDLVTVVGFGQGALHPAARGEVASDPMGDVDAAGMLLAELVADGGDRPADRALADVARRASSLDPRERFLTAAALGEALTSIVAGHPRPTIHPAPLDVASLVPSMQCPTCGAVVPGLRFCGGCGLRLPVRSLLPAAPEATPLPLPLVSREEDLAWLTDRRADVRGSLIGARLVGEPGAGKTRLVRELLVSAAEAGDRVIEIGPDPRDAEVAYYAVRRAILELVGDAIDVRSGRWEDAADDVRIALQEILHGLTSRGDARTADERRHAAGEALRWALSRAHRRSPERTILLVLEDLDRIDWSSRAAFADAIGEPPAVPCLFLATHVPGFDAGWPADNPARVLGGLPAEEVARLLPALHEGERLRARTDAAGRGVLPLYVEHAVRYRREGGFAPPARLGDLLARRVERLDPADRATLQALAVLGDGADAAAVTALLPAVDELPARLSRLVDAGLVARDGEQSSVAHGMLREIVLAHVPVSVRRELHERARRLFDSPDVPLEVRALHAHEAGHGPAALRLLGQVAERARVRGDLGSAAAALRRAWRLARRTAQPSPDADGSRTTLSLALALSATLLKIGGFSEAERILADMAALAPWHDRERAALRHVEALTHAARGRDEEARRAADEALALATTTESTELQSTLRALLVQLPS